MSETPVFMSYTREELDAQYDPSSAVSDIADYVRQWRELSATAVQRYTMHADLRYGDHEEELLDYFEPETRGAPLAIFFHGAWTRHDKSLFRYPALSLIPNGFAFATINCHRVPDVPLDVQLEQAREAVEWLVGQAEELGFDANRLCMVGHAAGAYLAAMMVTTDWTARLGVPESPVRSGLLASGVYDLEPVCHSHLNDSLQIDINEAFALSPIHHTPESPCPLVIAWGENDLNEFRRQSREFAAAWRRHEGPCNAFELPATNHYDLSLEYCDPEGPLIRALQSLFEEPDDQQAASE